MLNITTLRSGVLQLELFGEIAPWGGDGWDEAALSAALRDHSGNVQVLIQSPGGDATVGLAIHALLSAYKRGTVTTINIAQAASAAALVFAAGSKRLVLESAVTMIHPSWSGAQGDAQKMQQAAEMLAAFDRAQANLYVAATGKTLAEVEAKLAETSWMSAQEALNFGLATEIVSAEAIAAKGPKLHMVRNTATMPAMDLRAKLGLAADATDEQVTAALDALLAAQAAQAAQAAEAAKAAEAAQAAEAAKAAETALEEKIAARVEAALAARAARAASAAPEPEPATGYSHEVAVAAVVDAAIAAGKVQPAARAKAIAACGTSARSLDAMRQLWAVQASVLPTPIKAAAQGTEGAALTETQKLLIKASGLSRDEWLAARAALKEKV